MPAIDRTTLLQSLLLVIAGLALLSLILFAGRQKPAADAPPEVQSQPGAAAAPGAPDVVHVVTALSDSLHDRSEALALWLSTATDTTGLRLRADSLTAGVDRAIGEVEPYAPLLTPGEFESVISLYLDYLDAAALAEEPPAVRGPAAEAYLQALRESRAAVESRLVRRLGAF